MRAFAKFTGELCSNQVSELGVTARRTASRCRAGQWCGVQTPNSAHIFIISFTIFVREVFTLFVAEVFVVGHHLVNFFIC